ncbi:hypothetical protein EHI8A_027150 [Entamoeba histolytica HM-1:IMSS-B]|uniref:PRA1 family protein n=4 Tax=Entamoeba histolytica TaxID=5759 RepID=C4M779_ENTH1|nr:hypothetical protein EHI_199660 [Entamoeba histolytica HM-1:IMSS]EAL49357.1 hypothetical protein EHI_199660 [Entamoeba histolytica HM-1:IMSS]EMH76057.1 hypothetical protein EHI8A_027150 [Entamoeba histolytica HM-1:IMSS-B]ENY62181.1 hypothetical protein EHI7A_029940 [Entamoeba histolytica HM-1:IMSS-A]GAT97372.1 hypothetical protein CL6EHI_199660 [Entamoeba histolytica]|eukprot:XP_654744.1 hypothetical protein EHI_199660 [Entamoeba histolytica HM-1:IMSS]
MSCPFGDKCPIKPFFTKVLEQAKDAIQGPFVVPSNADEIKSTYEKNIKKYNELYLFLNGSLVFIGSLLAHPLAGILVLGVYVALVFTWDKYISKYVDKYFKDFKIPYSTIPILLFPLFFFFALLGECTIAFICFNFLAVLVVVAHSFTQRFGQTVEKKSPKETPVVSSKKEEKKEKKSKSSSSSSSSSSDEKH